MLERLLGKLIEVYNDDDCNKFDVGKLIAYNDECLLIQSYSPYGKENGYWIYRMEAIQKFSYDTAYLSNLNVKKDVKETITFDQKNLWDEILKLNIGEIFEIDFYNGGVERGVLKETNKDYCIFRTIMENGIMDGETIIFNQTIKGLGFQTNNCKLIKENLQK